MKPRNPYNSLKAIDKGPIDREEAAEQLKNHKRQLTVTNERCHTVPMAFANLCNGPRYNFYLLPVIIQTWLRRKVAGVMNVLEFPEDINARKYIHLKEVTSHSRCTQQ